MNFVNFDKEIENQRLKLDKQEVKPKLRCYRCGSEIYDGEEYYLYERDKLCEECFDEMQEDEKYESKRFAGDDDE